MNNRENGISCSFVLPIHKNDNYAQAFANNGHEMCCVRLSTHSSKLKANENKNPTKMSTEASKPYHRMTENKYNRNSRGDSNRKFGINDRNSRSKKPRSQNALKRCGLDSTRRMLKVNNARVKSSEED